MLDETPVQLVTHLSHPNGWWRDTAQQLLVLAQDGTVMPALRTLVRTSRNPLARFHALWTLEGLNGLDASLTRELLNDADPRLRIQALRASESLYKAGDRSFDHDYRARLIDADVDVAIQAMLTMHALKVPDASGAIGKLAAESKVRGVRFVHERISAAAGAARANSNRASSLMPEQQSSIERGVTIYNELCFSCHGSDGRGTPTPGAGAGATLAPSLVGSPRVEGHRDYVIKTILHGLAGPIDGRTYPQVMVAMGTNTDQWVADVTSFVRNGFGNTGTVATAADVARVRAAVGARGPWTSPELESTLPRALVPDSTWKVTASHDARPAPQANPEGGFNYIVDAAGALSFLGWTTGVPQQAGMWFQVELPTVQKLTEIQFTTMPVGGRGNSPAAWTYPRRYQVQVSPDGATWGPAIAEGEGGPGTTVIAFAPVDAKFVRITQTAAGDDAPPWSMRLLRLYVAPPGKGMR
jgi:mono/diheme cytochrome c family protein